MLPLIDKPIIQYVVEELVEAGIKDIIIIGSANKRAIEDHFDTPNEELLANLRAGGAKKAAAYRCRPAPVRDGQLCLHPPERSVRQRYAADLRFTFDYARRVGDLHVC